MNVIAKSFRFWSRSRFRLLAAAWAGFGVTISALGQQPYSIGPAAGPVAERFFGRGNYLFSAGFDLVSGIDISIGGFAGPYDFQAVPPLEGGTVGRSYNNGFVAVDAAGNADDLTTNWGYNDSSQISTERNTITFDMYSSPSTTALSASDSGDGQAVDLQFGRILFHVGNHAVLGLVGGMNIGTLDASGQIQAPMDLVTLTDTYSLNGITPPEPPFTGGGATGPAIGSVIIDRTTTATPGGATLFTNWRLKGAYYNFRIGPSFYYQINRLLAVQVGAGANSVWASTDFSYGDVLAVKDISNDRGSFTTHDDSWMIGYYAEASVQLWLNEFAGIFVSGGIHQADDYRHRNGTRFADIDFGATTSYGVGLTCRF